MKLLHLVLVTSLVFCAQSCASAEKEVPTDQLNPAPNIERHDGSIINIREVKKDASLGKQFGGSLVGALIGGQLGGGSASTILGTSGAFIGADIVNEKYGETVDRLILKDDSGREYECLVHGHGFKVGDKVTFTIVANHVSAIIHAE